MSEAFEAAWGADDARRLTVGQLLRSHEADRKRLADGIHDDTLQIMAALGLRLGTLRPYIDHPQGVQQLRRVDEILHMAIARLRHLMFELWPRSLEDQGLAAACRDALTEMAEAGVIRDHSLAADLDPELPVEIRLALYRVIQELLRNVRQHAHATRVEVSVTREGNRVRARVCDNGVGFDPAETASTELGGLGLAVAMERLYLLGGGSEVRSAPGAGTAVEVWIPEPVHSGGSGAADG